MCNAWNHAPSCTCGWGGEGHTGGGWNWGAHTAAYPAAVPIFSSTHSAHSFTNPNARCPVCSASVYFYQSPHGGRVFFDDLGPPWPKHPCTDNRLISTRIAVSMPRQAVTTKKYQWQLEGWTPLIQAKLEKVRSTVYRISAANGFSAYLKCNSARLHKPQPILGHLKTSGTEKTVSFYWIDDGARQFRCHDTVDDALSALDAPKRSLPKSSPSRRVIDWNALQRVELTGMARLAQYSKDLLGPRI